MSKNRRRSLSASRTLDSTVNFVGRIGASLRISSRKRAEEKQKLGQSIDNNSENWLQSGVHYAKVGIERRRSTCSAIFFGSNKGPKLYFADEDCIEKEEDENKDENDKYAHKKAYSKRYQPRSNSVVSSHNQRLIVYNEESKPKRLNNIFRSTKSNVDFMNSIKTHKEEYSLQFIDTDDYNIDDDCDYLKRQSDEDDDEEENDPELLNLALVPLSYNESLLQTSKSQSAVSSPINTSSSLNNGILTSTLSCPSTPQTPRRRYLKEGATQLTSLTTLCTHHRYLFLFNDLLLVSKQNSETERNEWFNKLNDCIQRRITSRPKITTISVAVRIDGRHQLIREEIENGVCASQIVQELINTLDLPTLDQNLFHYELCFESGACNNNLNLTSNNSNVTTNGGTLNSNILNSCRNNLNQSSGGNTQISSLSGVENVYAILMDHVINRIGVSLSDSRLAHLDTCPLINCRLVLRQAANNNSSSSGHSRSSTALSIVNQFRKVLSRTDSSSKKLFGRQLEGSMPPQPVLTMIDHLTIHGSHVEGIFRKSPKQATVRVLKTQLDHGQVPDFHQFNVHVTASLLKEYLRTIPGQLLISGNYHLWMEISEEQQIDKKLKTCRQLLRLLPPSHTVLLRSVLRLLRRIANAESTSKMNAQSLAICIAPSLLENPNFVDSARRVPKLAVYLIQNANNLFDNFVDDTLLIPSIIENVSASVSTAGSEEGNESHILHQSTDSGLSDDVTSGSCSRRNIMSKTQLNASNAENFDELRANSISPDSALFEIPTPECSGDDERFCQSQNCSISPDQQNIVMHHVYSELDEEDDRTPVLSRENSDVKTQFPNRYQWKSHLSNSMIGKPGADIHNYNEPQSPDLSVADIRILRLQPGFSSPCVSPNLSINSSTTDQFCNSILKNSLTTKLMPNVVSNVDELRVSDFIIRSNSGLKRNDDKYEIDELYTPIAMSEHSSRKPSIVSIRSDSRQTSGRKSSIASVDSQNTTPNLRRATLITKSETLGLTPNAVLNTKKPLIVSPTSIEKSTLNNQSISALMDSELSYQTQLKNNIIVNKTSNLSNSSTTNLAPKLKRTNSSSMNACIAAAKVQHQRQQRQYNIVQRDSNIKDASKLNTKTNAVSNLVQRSSTNNSAVAWKNGSAYGVEADENIISTTKITRRQSDKRNNATTPSTTSAASGILSRNIANTTISHRKSVGATESLTVLRSFPSHKTNHRPWRPPKRTAEEIILDKNLEVNWSVSSIRSVFQNKKDDKPAAIDTVYAKFDAIPKTSTNN